MRPIRLLLLAAVGLSLATVAFASPASAHASLIEATPADGARIESGPGRVELRFTESISVSGDSMRVLGTDGKRVDDGRPSVDGSAVSVGLDGDLRDDTYIVAYRVVSADGHPVHGATTFVVGDGPEASDATIASLLGDEGDGPWPALGALVRALSYAGALVAIGAVAWGAAVDRGVLRRPARVVAVVSAVVGGVGLVLSIPVQAALTTGLGLDAATDTSVLSDVLGSPLGVGALLALGGLLLVAVAPAMPRAIAFAVLGAVIVAVGFARSGHTETTDPRALMHVADIVHILAAGAWLGGLVLAARELLATRRGSVPVATATERIVHFSIVAAIASIAAAVAGVVLGWGTVRSFDALTSTTYGSVLLVKIGLVALVGVAAVFNHWWLLPAVRENDRDARRLLLHTIRIEMLGLFAAVVVTASLVNLEPARVAASPGMFDRTVAFGDATAVVQVDPARPGQNAIHLYLLDAAGRQLDLPESPTFDLRLAAEEIGPITRTPWRVGRGHYILDGPEFSIPGTWTLEIRARVSTFDETAVTIDIPIR